MHVKAPASEIENLVSDFSSVSDWHPMYFNLIEMTTSGVSVCRKALVSSFEYESYGSSIFLPLAVGTLIDIEDESTETPPFRSISFRTVGGLAVQLRTVIVICGNEEDSVISVQLHALTDCGDRVSDALCKLADCIAKNLATVSLAFATTKSVSPRPDPGTFKSRSPTLNIVSIPRVHTVSGDELIDKFLVKDEPVIITGFCTGMPWWPDAGNPEFWEQFGGAKAILAFRKNHDSASYDKDWKLCISTIGFFFKHHNRNKLMTLYNSPRALIPGLRNIISSPVPNNCLGQGGSFWVGCQGLIAHMHIDGALQVDSFHPQLSANLNLQLSGRKRWVIAHPQHSAHLNPAGISGHGEEVDYPRALVSPWDGGNILETVPAAGNVKFYECVLEEGEMLLIPTGWWHGIYYIEDSINLNFFFSSERKLNQ